MASEQPHYDHAYVGSDTDRLVTFSDGVFAFAITLLVITLTLTPPFSTYQGYLANLGTLGVSSFYYLVTFAVIASYWQSNRHIMRIVRRQDTIFTWLTFLNLAFVVYFPVALNILLKSHDTHGNTYILGAIIYTLALAGTGFSSFVLWTYATFNHHLIDTSLPRAEIRLYNLLRLVIPVYYCLSLVLLFLPPIARHPEHLFYSWLALPLITLTVRRLMNHGISQPPLS